MINDYKLRQDYTASLWYNCWESIKTELLGKYK